MKIVVFTNNTIMKLGLGFRYPLKQGIFKSKDSLDCLEIISEQFLTVTEFQRRELNELTEHFTIIPHGLRLSIGSVERPPQSYLDKIARLLQIIEPPYYSDHFAITSIADIDIGHLSPLLYTEDSLEIVIKNIHSIRSFLGIPLIFETITHPFYLPNNTMSQEEFITKVCHETGCGILLDVTNIFINSKNLGVNAKSFVKELPKQSIKQLHIVGYTKNSRGLLIDSHSTKIQSDIWELYQYVISNCKPDYLIIERDANFPDIAELISEVDYARQLQLEESA